MSESAKSIASSVDRLQRRKERLIGLRDKVMARIAEIDERLAALELASTLQNTGRQRAASYAIEIMRRMDHTK